MMMKEKMERKENERDDSRFNPEHNIKRERKGAQVLVEPQAVISFSFLIFLL